MIYGYSSSSSSSALIPPDRPQLAVEYDERQPLLSYQNQNFWSPSASGPFGLGASDITQTETIPAARYHEQAGRMATLRKFAKKLETDNEPGLTHTQLMLTNYDLKPGMPFLLPLRSLSLWNILYFIYEFSLYRSSPSPVES